MCLWLRLYCLISGRGCKVAVACGVAMVSMVDGSLHCSLLAHKPVYSNNDHSIQTPSYIGTRTYISFGYLMCTTSGSQKKSFAPRFKTFYFILDRFNVEEVQVKDFQHNRMKTINHVHYFRKSLCQPHPITIKMKSIILLTTVVLSQTTAFISPIIHTRSIVHSTRQGQQYAMLTSLRATLTAEELENMSKEEQLNILGVKEEELALGIDTDEVLQFIGT